MLERKKDYKAWLYMGIPLLLLCIFTFYPLIKTILVSLFSQYNAVENSFGVAFDIEAYKALFYTTDPSFTPPFVTSIGNTLLLVFISVPVSTIIALLVAVALNSIKPLQKIFQTIFFLPYVTNALAIGMVFQVMFGHSISPGVGVQEGLINALFGLNKDWVGITANRSSWMFVVLIYTIWEGLPFKILVFIGGLQSISKQYYEAAKIDSTPSWRVLRRVTVPLLSPMISYILITSFIGAFKSYESVLAVAGSLSGLDYKRFTVVAFVYDNIGRAGMIPEIDVSYYSRAAAAAVVLFAIIMAITAVNLFISKKKVHY
ncbi:MAG: sugar ABC transporter permease [Acholeplasmatales bacterium]|jgi:multiple sugar transport system permease protein|nr:sugar ABC transporter permease [Acholeplasmatales bacterium]